MKKKQKKFIKKKSFFFKDYPDPEINFDNIQHKSVKVSLNRTTFLFFIFFSLIFIFSIKIIYLSFFSEKNVFSKKSNYDFIKKRADIIDRNGILISRNVKSFHAAIKPNLIKNKGLMSRIIKHRTKGIKYTIPTLTPRTKT